MSRPGLFSLIFPVYRNEASLPSLLVAADGIVDQLLDRHGVELELVFVVDGSPDGSFSELSRRLPGMRCRSKLIAHSRNFGAFAAIRTGLESASGEHFGVMAADLQEPPELIVAFAERLLSGTCDVVVGTRESREDPWSSRALSGLFWSMYRKFVLPEIPKGGVDVFGCNRAFRDHLISLRESNSSLVGLIYWLGFRRAEVKYGRRQRQFGKSAWSFRKKVRYLLDSVYSFTDLPIRLLTAFGVLGVLVSVPLGIAIAVARIAGLIEVPGYAATMVSVVFFGAVNSLGLGIVGSYAWRTYENTKTRPLALVATRAVFEGAGRPAVAQTTSLP